MLSGVGEGSNCRSELTDARCEIGFAQVRSQFKSPLFSGIVTTMRVERVGIKFKRFNSQGIVRNFMVEKILGHLRLSTVVAGEKFHA